MPLSIAFRCDASPAIGHGHLTRCLTLADELAGRGARCIFIVGSPDGSGAERARRAGHEAVAIAQGLGEQADRDATLAALPAAVDWGVVDSYGLGRLWEHGVRAKAGRILVLDDLADRPHDADILVDPTVGRSPDDYRALAGERSRILAGGSYALLRQEFAAARRRRRSTARNAPRLHVGFGGGPWAPEAWEIVAALAEQNPDLAILANAGFHVGIPPRVRALAPRVDVRVSSDRIAADLAECTMALGAPGSMTWERFCLGIPFACLTTHPTQRGPVSVLARGGYLVDLGALRVPDDDLLHAISGFMADRTLLAGLAAKGAAAVDGEGVRRVADALLGASR